MSSPLPPRSPLAWLRRPAGPIVVGLLGLLILAAPFWLFADSLRSYRVQGDDFAYVGASRTLSRAVSNLFTPHNAHIVPAWRLLTWGFVAWAGSIAALPTTLGIATALVLPMAMVVVGLIVARETGKPVVGLVAMSFAGITSILKSPATWYSAGQTLWAGLGILLTLLAVQGWRLRGGWWRLALSAFWAVVAGGFWTIGHVSGIAAAVYLIADGRLAARRASLVPFLATVAAVGVSFGLGARKIEVEVRFEGTDADKAMNPFRGASHTLQSIAETLVIGNLGVGPEIAPLDERQGERILAPLTSEAQAGVIALSLVGLWLWTFRRGGRPTPLECAGGTILAVGYLVAWTFRGYYSWVNLRGVVPWYDAIPHLGAVLFVAGWWQRVWAPGSKPEPLTWGGALGVLVLVAGLIVVHEPRAVRLFMGELPKLTPGEKKAFPIVELQRLRSIHYAQILRDRQREHFYRLDRAEAVARKAGIGLDLIHRAFGRVLTPGLPEKAYDASEMLDLPRVGRETDPARARQLLAPLFVVTPEPPYPLDEVLRTIHER